MGSAEIELAETFAKVARSLLAEEDVEQTLGTIVDVALSVVEGCEHAGIDIVEKGTITPVAPSSDIAARIDHIQTEVGEGPCLSAIRDHDIFRSDDLADDPRWPTFSQRAYEETGIRSIVGFRLYTAGDTMGALDLYSSQPSAFDDDAVAVGSVLAAHAAVALAT